MSQFYSGRRIGQHTNSVVNDMSGRDKTAEELHRKGSIKKHEEGIDLDYFYSLSALTPRTDNYKNIKLSATERRAIKDILNKGTYLDSRETWQIRAAMQESSWLYDQLTHMDVKELTGNAYSLGERKLYSGRTISGRFSRKLAVNGSHYELQETDSYISLSWRDFANIAAVTSPEQFESILAGFFHEALALDTLRIGFNGKFSSPETDPDTWPLGDDVNEGWNEVAKKYNNGSQVLTDNITLGTGGDFKDVDSLANHLIKTRIPRHMRDNPRLVVLVGAELAQQERLKLFDGSVSTTDTISAQSGLERVAGRFAIVPPFMPGKRLTITTLSNLHIYTQAGSEFYREGFSDNRDYFWSLLRQEGYGVEDCTMYAAADEGAVTLV